MSLTGQSRIEYCTNMAPPWYGVEQLYSYSATTPDKERQAPSSYHLTCVCVWVFCVFMSRINRLTNQNTSVSVGVKKGNAS